MTHPQAGQGEASGDPWVVLLFGSADPDCPLNRCPMYAAGPYPNYAAAVKAVEALPAEMVPHLVPLRDD